MRGLVLACALMLCGCARGTAPGVIGSGAQCETPVVMSSGVTAKAVLGKEGEGGCTLTCTYGGKEHTFFTPRDCAIYADPAVPGSVVLWDRDASNEDHLVCVDLNRGDEFVVYDMRHED